MKDWFPIWFYWLFLAFLGTTNGAKILGIFALGSPSHFTYHRAMMQSLAEAGHQITVFSPFIPSESDKNIRYIKSRTTEAEIAVSDFKDAGWQHLIKYMINEVVEAECYDLLNVKEMKEILNSSTIKYDVMFVEMMAMYECYLPIAKKLAIPVIGTVSMRPWASMDHEFGNPHPFVLPFLLSSNKLRMTIYQRLKNLIEHLQFDYIRESMVFPKLQKFYSLNYPDYNLKTDKEISLLFTNFHSSILPKASMPTVVDIGGVHIKPKKPLPENIQKFIDEAEQGVILFTIGSFTSTSSVEMSFWSVFVEAFAQIPQRVIWKFHRELPNLSKNVMISNWLPQRDILAHKNVKAFITHTGQHGTLEAIHEAKPTIMVPFQCDQLSNAAILAERGVGIRLTVTNLTTKELLDAIDQVLNDQRYAERMKELSQAFKDRPLSPQEAVVYWTEYVIRFNGTRHLTAVLSDIPFYTYYMLDVLAICLLCIFSLIFILYYSILKIYSIISMKNRLLKINKKKD